MFRPLIEQTVPCSAHFLSMAKPLNEKKIKPTQSPINIGSMFVFDTYP